MKKITERKRKIEKQKTEKRRAFATDIEKWKNPTWPKTTLIQMCKKQDMKNKEEAVTE